MSKILKAQVKWTQGTKLESETRGFKLIIDKPLEENGTNLGNKPAELSLQALGGCILFAYLYAANKLRVDIEDLKVEVEGEVVSGGWTDEQNIERTGFKQVKFAVQVKTKHSEETIKKVHQLAKKVSPMFDNFSHAVKLEDSFSIY
ncbi:MAG: OsmC family peroxiredoxin [Candidatus Atribacteria bacterium]|nr:MAG: OsmC family peroxiredoxin [Candidatus Atribacteria bacterium]